jgi:CRISPR-associated protein Cmr1
LIELILLLASFGQRSRRGFGALQWSEHSFHSVMNYIDTVSKTLTALHINHTRYTNSIKLNRNHSGYPSLTGIFVGEGAPSAEHVRKQFGFASHKANPSGHLGKVIGGKWSSPLWGTIRKIGEKYYPIISELASPDTDKINRYVTHRNYFLEEMGVNWE